MLPHHLTSHFHFFCTSSLTVGAVYTEKRDSFPGKGDFWCLVSVSSFLVALMPTFSSRVYFFFLFAIVICDLLFRVNFLDFFWDGTTLIVIGDFLTWRRLRWRKSLVVSPVCCVITYRWVIPVPQPRLNKTRSMERRPLGSEPSSTSSLLCGFNGASICWRCVAYEFVCATLNTWLPSGIEL